MGFLEILKNGILKIKFELLEFLKNFENGSFGKLFKNGILKIKFKNLNFGKLFENGISEN